MKYERVSLKGSVTYLGFHTCFLTCFRNTKNELGIHIAVSHFGFKWCSCENVIIFLLSHCLNGWPRLHGRSHIMRCFYFHADSFFLTCKVCSFQEGGNRPLRLAAFHCTQFPYSVSCCSQGLTWIHWNSSLNSLLPLQIQSFFCVTQKIIHMNMITYDNRPR